MAPACHDGTSPADSLGQWTVVALRVGLTPDQRTLLASWRLRFLKKIDDCYGRRLLHKAQASGVDGPCRVGWGAIDAMLLGRWRLCQRVP
jgi:hypothetical protein